MRFFERFGAAKVERIIHFGVPFSWPYSIKNRKTDIQKGIEKMKPEKYRQLVPKGSHIYVEIDANIEDV